MFRRVVISAIESANEKFDDQDALEYAYWKSTIRKDMKVRIAGKSKLAQLDILMKWYATTREYQRFIPIAKMIDNYHMNTVRARFSLCDKFWEKHEENEAEWFWQSVVHSDSDKKSLQDVSDMVYTATQSIRPIHADIGALMTADDEGLWLIND